METAGFESSIVRCATAGSVDDGKSTLIGRLLLDCNALFRDQLEHVEEASRRRGYARTELALLTDGLRAEREQGITIDVAWRYFSTKRRRFILADTPGHVEYTRNMATGASHADVAIVLADAERGTTEQTRRHLVISALFGVPQIIVAVNKMDRVGFSADRFIELVNETRAFVQPFLRGSRVSFVPVSALLGANVAHHASEQMPWYDGETLLELLEGSPSSRVTSAGGPDAPGILPVQWIIRPQSESHADYRGIAGRIAHGSFAVGDRVVVLPSQRETFVARIERRGGDAESAQAGDSVTLHLGDDVHAGIGDVVAKAGSVAPELSQRFTADVFWLAGKPAQVGKTYALRHLSRTTRAVLTDIHRVIDLATSGDVSRPLAPNEIGTVTLETSDTLPIARYEAVRALGRLLLVEEASRETVGALMVRSLG